MSQRWNFFYSALAVTLIVMAGAGAGWWGYQKEGTKILDDLTLDAVHCSVGFAPAEVAQLTGTKADMDGEVYARVKTRLRRFHRVDPNIKFIYIFRHLPAENKVIFLADSADPGASDESLPGDDYPEAPKSPGLQEIIRTGQPTTEGPLRDSFGMWVTAYALFGPPPSAGAPRDILGVDMSASDWNRQVWTSAASHALFVWVTLGLPFAVLTVLRREREQREAIRNLSEAMEQSHSAVLIVALDSCIEYANAGLCRQLGYTRRELIGRNWRDFQSPEMPPEFVANVVTTVRAGRSWQGEWMIRRKAGTHYPVRGVVSPVVRKDGALTCFVLVFEDMTEVKRNEAVLREAKERAEAGDRAKGQFLATMSHEVRTPLNGILGFTNLLLETPLTPDQLEYVETIRTSGETLIQLTGDILDYARIESGKLKLDPQPCNMRECLEDTLDLIAGRSADRDIELLHSVDASVPEIVLIDGGRLRQVLLNLIGNAQKFTDAGEIEVNASAERRAAGTDDAGGWLLRFAVRDTGAGIAQEDQARLFKPFSQLDASTTRRHGGAGLGLAISRNIVELMGGGISLESEPGRGSTFTFTVQAEEVAMDAVPQTPPAPASGLRLAVAMPPGKLREEIARIGARGGAQVAEIMPGALAAKTDWDLAVLNVSDALVAELSARPEPREGWPAEKIIGLVRLSLPAASRAALRPHFRLLLSKPVHHAALGNLITGAAAADAAVTPRELFDLRVLLVEDNPVSQRLMRKVLDNLGCTWALAEHGRAAVEELRRTRHDVVLMDLHMPEMDGLTAMAEIRSGAAGPEAAGCWIIALTADVREEQRTRAAAAGADDYLTKPLQLAELSTALKRCGKSRRG